MVSIHENADTQFETDIPEQDTMNEDGAASKISYNQRNLVCNKYVFRYSRKGYKS